MAKEAKTVKERPDSTESLVLIVWGPQKSPGSVRHPYTLSY